MFGLIHLEVVGFTLRSSEALQSFLSSQKLRSCTPIFQNSTLLDISGLADLKNLSRLRINGCNKSEELRVFIIQHFGFHSLQGIEIISRNKIKDLTFLVFGPNLKSTEVRKCDAIETIVSDVAVVMGNLNPSAKLQFLGPVNLPNLRSIYWKPLPFLRLKEMIVDNCYELKKLPLDFNTEREHKFVIPGKESWWQVLQWEDEAIKSSQIVWFGSITFRISS